MSEGVRPKRVLIVAHSGRMLAQAAKNAGFIPLVVDLYADQDTQALSAKVFQVTELSQQYLLPVLNMIKQEYVVDHACFGSGLEAYPESLSALSNAFNLSGNVPSVVQKIQDKAVFFSILKRLAIAFPDTVFSAPDDDADWLIKPMQGQGGLGIRHRIRQDDFHDNVYWQRYIEGVPGSVLFLANSCQSHIIGFNTQWCRRDDDQHAFLFSGVINQSPLNEFQQQTVAEWLELLVSELGLTGLNSLDFMVQGDKVLVVEINPRPSASMQLYDMGGLMAAQIDPLAGLMPGHSFRYDGFCAYQVVFAGQDLLVPDAVCWPVHAVDLPGPGQRIRQGSPLCSLIVRNATVEGLLQALKATRKRIFQIFNTG
ncbi:ATP-grasp domain-containing protein [Methylicorpusculum oleiharenae]|uniref:ATP-grasp domain-containing protein n=1 Tax=Methylicorpusculum oleiharenae TaxID=1338687 RepID=UPI00135A6555|nr:ATP-grasp domain-containing protein [Methylicorpusculum oleiharenae]MCD2452941.1 ATP-grasp domain-containing protein [Methylicorpusculum oleiharenae]